jgi:gliding motility-associated-like protein
VRVVCDATTSSVWSAPYEFNTPVCEEIDQCNYVFEMIDSFGDGWNGNTMTIFQGGVPVATIGSTFTTGEGPVTVEVPLCPGVPFEVFWNTGGAFANEVGVTMYTPFAEDVFTKAPGTGSQNSIIFSNDGTLASCTPPPCPKPQDLVVDDILLNSAEFDWTEMGTATSWEVEVVLLGDAPTGAGTVVTSHPHVWEGLESGTTYQFYVRAICGGTDGNSNWSGPNTFTTAIENDDCAGALPVPVNAGGECIEYAAGTLTGATGSTQAQTCVTWTTIQWDVWYSFTAEATTHAVAVTDQVGAFYQTVIYEGDDCGSLTQLACGDDNQVVTGLTIGETYYVRVYTTFLNNPTAPTSFHICVQTPVPPITVSDTLYTVPELVEEVLIDADCALVSNITWSTGSNFGQSNGIGYFNQNGSDFPFEEGVILATGGITEAPGPWPGVATFDNPGWPGDADLAAIIAANGQTNPIHNASKLEFDFVPTIDQLSFEFIFASSEYGIFQCFFSDAFAFILTDLDAGGTPVPVNLAVIPTTTIPVSVVNIRNSLYNAGCASANEEYFDQYNPDNPNNSAIGYNGQTVVMTAQSPVIPGHQYHIKMVIADYSDSSVNSAVFIGGGTFNFGEIDLGDAMLEFTGTAACDGETVVLETGMDPDLYDFVWTQDGVVMPAETGPTLNVTIEGTYAVEATFEGTDCAANGEVLIQFYDPIVDITNDPVNLNICDASGFASFNLEDNTPVVLGDLTGTFNVTYHLSQSAAEQGIDALTSPYTNVVQYQQPIFVRVETASGCVGIKSFNLNVEDLTPEFDIPVTLALCEGGTGTITVTPENFDVNGVNVSFTWTHNGNPLPDTGASISVTEAGDYEVIVNNTGCTATATTAVTVSPTPDASISYAGTPYCSDGTTATVTHTGNIGGTYSSSAGLAIDSATGEIDLAASTPGTYTVNYDLAATATCDAFSTNTVVVITPAPKAGFDYDATTFCMNFGSTVAPSFATDAVAGTFTVDVAGLDINPATGIFNPATSTAGTYIVTNTIAAADGCGEVTANRTITIIEAPVPTFSYSQPAYCQEDATDPSPILAGVAGTFSAPAGLVIDPVTGEIDLSASQPGTYIVENTIAATAECAEVSYPVTVVINATPVFSLGGPYNVCDAQFATITVDADNFDSTTASYVWTLDGIALPDTGSSITASGFGTYEVTVTTAAGCVAPLSVAVTQNTSNVEFSFFDGCEGNIYSLEVDAVNGSFNPDTAAFTWTGPDGFIAPAPGTVGMATIMPNIPGTYTVSFVTPEGCIGTLPYEVLSTSCFVQNGISPGDADSNNTFDLTALDVTSISIFNRYGQEVFSYGNYTNQWGGQDNSGNELPTGTYFYSFERANGETKTGWIYVNRQN